MGLEPSSWKDLAIRPDLDAVKRAMTRPGFGWLLIVVGLMTGFAVGTRIVAMQADRAPTQAVHVERAVQALPEVSLAAATRPDEAPRESVSDPAVTTRTRADAEPPARADAHDGEYELAAHKLTTLANPTSGVPGLVADGVADRLEQEARDERIGERVSPPVRPLPAHAPERGTGPVDSLTIVTRGRIREGESLGASLRRQGISPGTVHLIATEMRKVFDFRHSRPGDEYRLGQDSQGRVLDFRYSQDDEESFYLGWEGTRYVVRKETAELRPQIAKIAGIVDSSFYGAIRALGEQSALATDFARILAWDIDFSRNVHPGDEFSILYERLYRRNDDGEEVYVRPGRILAGRYAGNVGHHTVVYFEDASGVGAYFRPDGSSVERAFLAAPLEFSRISSRFTRARRHPILDVTRPHPGIDYAAPHGTPVWAVAEGVVEYKARAGASGNLIRVRHTGGYTSHYAHLSGFAKNLDVGDHVEQKQIIGYVGSTGLSTGPHVCFRVKKNGRYVDPMKISSPAGAPVDGERLNDFETVRDQLLADLGPGPINMADEAL